MASTRKTKNLVADSGAFILRSPIQDYAENVFTLSDVIAEIKDESTSQSLQVLPYEIKYREPTEEDMKFVTNFAKRTGDFNQLSLTDLRVLALTVRLEKEINNGINLKEVPAQVTILPTKPPGEKNENPALRDLKFFGYDVKAKLFETKKENDYEQKDGCDEANKIMEDTVIGDEGKINENDSKSKIENLNSEDKLEDDHHSGEKLQNAKVIFEDDDDDVEESNDDDNDDDEDDDDDDEDDDDDDESIEIGEDEGWITKENCVDVRRKLMGLKVDDRDSGTEPLNVACVTGDYAMQNLLLQMGLNVIAPRDGLQIRRTRQFVLRCFACGRINPATATKFCKFCGNLNTLKRVSVTVRQDGSTEVHINFRKPINVRGTKFSLPMPRAGKHANNPILCEDQHMPQQRKSKIALQEKKQLTIDSILNDPDYLVRANPFSVNDVYSRASRVTTHQRKSVNPNETRKPTGNKKKKKNRYV